MQPTKEVSEAALKLKLDPRWQAIIAFLRKEREAEVDALVNAAATGNYARASARAGAIEEIDDLLRLSETTPEALARPRT